MRLAEYETDARKVYGQVVDGRTDIPWLRAQLARLTAATGQLDPPDRSRADLLLGRLREVLAADEADEAWAAAGGGDHPVARAIQLRATAGWDGDPSDHAGRLDRLRAARAEVDALAEATQDRRLARLVRQESWLITQQIAALETAAEVVPDVG